MTTTLTKNSLQSGGLASAAIAASSDPSRLVEDVEASDILGGVKKQTLSVWRLRGCGPPFIKIGRLVRYRVSDLMDYIESRRVNNTAEADKLDD